MSNLEFFTVSSVQYPAKEEAMAFRGAEGLPVKSAVIGITYPSPDYYIRRDAEIGINCFEYVIEGEGELLLDGEWVRARAGDTYILCAGEAHEYRSDPKKPWKKVWINFKCDYIAALFKAYRVRSGVYAADTRAYFDTMYALSRSGRPYGEICFTIADCIHRVVACAAVSARRGLDTDGFLIREALTAAVYKKAGLDEIAAGLHMSKSNMIRTFKRDYGLTPYEFLLNAKMDAAKLLLKNTRMTVKEIADRVCVADEHYFSSLFLKRVGQRPGAYRRGEPRPAAADRP